jgi:hypothetical protein
VGFRADEWASVAQINACSGVDGNAGEFRFPLQARRATENA